LVSFFLALHLTWRHRFSYTSLPFVLQAEKVFNQDLYFKRTVKYVGEPMTHLESIASSAVRSMCFSDSSLFLLMFGKHRFCSLRWFRCYFLGASCYQS
jgi:hypothetical protein